MTKLTTYRAALIDLDGTLVDTVSEIAAAANAMLADAGLPPISEHTASESVGEGSGALVASLVGPTGLDRWLPVYMAHYRRSNGTAATVYPQVREGLAAMREAGLAVACVTNKPRELVGPLFEKLGIADLFDCIVGGGDTDMKKPHPAPLLFACKAMGVAPGECVMIGDSKNDALAAAAAGATSLTVPYGYPGFGGAADDAAALLERGDTYAIVPDLLAAA
ncbi:MAG: HAD-IA family hydrolase, partial [Burkholderiaceae bacterium]